MEKTNIAIGNLKKIAVVDDLPENREAGAEALKEIFPSAEVVVYASAKEIITELKKGVSDIDLIFTDMNMEEKDSGFKVATESWGWMIPCIPVSGGIKTHTTDQVAVGSDGQGNIHIHGEKSEKSIWIEVIRKSIHEKDFSASGVIKALYYGKRSEADYGFGRASAVAMCCGLDFGYDFL